MNYYLIFFIASVIVIFIAIRSYQKSLKAVRHNYQKLFNGSPIAIYIMSTPDLKIIAVNHAMTKLYGYTEKELLDMYVPSIRSKEYHERFENHIETADKNIGEKGIWQHRKKNGKLFYVKLTSHRVPQLKKDAILVMVTDIDHVVKNKKKINDLILLYQTVNKATNDVIWDYDVVNDKLHWMEGLEEKFGYTKNPTTDNFWLMLKVHPDDREKTINKFRLFIEQRKSEWFCEYRFICADGSTKYVRDKGCTLFNEQGEAIRIIGAMQDIDQQRQYEQKLEEQNKNLKEIAWLNSHEVRRPLSNILGLVALISERSNHDEEIKPLVDLLHKSSRELDEAINLINKQTVQEEAP
ncbi:PAS domain S-box protein [Pedobacter sp. ASV28]|uniref:PAS domain-containing protein n=1 Tax=Pedobacter sp. ASV28 TaxID=2795123 RepID=UPI0018EB87FF|nr:PAS domain S-box protein [Pedobacter sp. ASV28]